MAEAEQPGVPRGLAAVAAVVVVGGLGLRLAAASTNLWQDEVWSLWLLGRVTAPADVFTAVHHDNNHPLNSLFLYALGERQSWLLYRLLALASGAGAIVLAGAVARRRGAAEALTAVMLFAASFLMVLYSSEARGYMPAVFAALLAFLAFERDGTRPDDGRDALLFGLAIVLGMLSHLTFILVYAGFVQWMLAKRPPLRDLVRWHGLPIACLAVLYVIDVRHMEYGGVSEPIPLERSLGDLASLTFGLPGTAAGAALGAVGLVAVAVAGLARLRRDGGPVRTFFVTCFAAMLAVQIAVGATLQIWLVRYGLVVIAFFYVLFALVLGRVYRAGPGGKAVYALVLTVFCAANGWRSLQLTTLGRGGYPEALARLAAETPGDVVRLAGSDDAGISLLVWFYGPRVSSKRFVYEARGHSGPPPPWFIQTSTDPEVVPPPALEAFGGRYALAETYDCYTSCARWFVYRAESS
ncbi:MAG TPA: glycosyltransferase family 39 protein [Dehalococcoidia bacterium]|nr:glycosyltransferase family 39 protein [Dehalococcoidia bacterium]